MIAIATACLILMSTNFEYIFPGSVPLVEAVMRPLSIISIRFGCFWVPKVVAKRRLAAGYDDFEELVFLSLAVGLNLLGVLLEGG